MRREPYRILGDLQPDDRLVFPDRPWLGLWNETDAIVHAQMRVIGEIDIYAACRGSLLMLDEGREAGRRCRKCTEVLAGYLDREEEPLVHGEHTLVGTTQTSSTHCVYHCSCGTDGYASLAMRGLEDVVKKAERHHYLHARLATLKES